MGSAIDYKALGQRIRKARRSAGMTQEKLGEVCSISTAHIGHIERGTRIPSLDTFFRIADALKVSADELLADSPKSPESTLISIAKSLDGKDKGKIKSFVNAVKALADNIEDL